MTNYKRCQTCNEYGWEHSHICDPVYTVQFGDTGYEYQIHANHAAGAAEKAAEKYDRDCEYDIVGGDSTDVTVICPDGKIVTCHVSGEPVPTYSAYETAVAVAA